MKQSGTYDPNILDLSEIQKIITQNLNGFKYKNFIVYDSKICQYHERNEETYGKCAEVCPTISILKEDETKHLVFSEVDCHNCGGSISVCPSGALVHNFLGMAITALFVTHLYMSLFAIKGSLDSMISGNKSEDEVKYMHSSFYKKLKKEGKI